MNTPWRVNRNDNRVSIIGIDGRVMTEILPGQVKGAFVTVQERLDIAEFICDSINYDHDTKLRTAVERHGK